MLQAEREGWSDESIDHAMDRSEDKEDRVVQRFVDAVDEVQAREQSEYHEQRRRGGVQYDSDAEEQAALDEESDSDDEARPIHTIRGNERQVFADICEDNSDSDGESEGLPRHFGSRCGLGTQARSRRSVGFDLPQRQIN